MSKTITYFPKDVCSRQYDITYDNGIIENIRIVEGCPGNTLGISYLLKGMEIDKAISLLENITCRGSKTGQTSCPQQISLALKSIR